MPPRRCREAKSQLVFRLGFELVPVVSPTGTHPAPHLSVCVCFTGIGHINVLGPNPLTLQAVQSEENLAADGIPGRLRLASAMPVCRAAVRRPDAATKVP